MPFSARSGGFRLSLDNAVLPRQTTFSRYRFGSTMDVRSADDGRKQCRWQSGQVPTTGVEARSGAQLSSRGAGRRVESDRTKSRRFEPWDVHVIAHGGAGSPADDPDDRAAVLDEAVDCGAEQSTPLSAVRATVRVLEVDPRFNAGIGGAVQSDGVPRTDAGVMCGDGRTGAAAAMPGVAHAVDVAGAVATGTPHVMLAGERAVAFAESVGVETGVDLWSDASREQWVEADPPGASGASGGTTPDTDAQLAWVRDRFGRDGDGSGSDGGGTAGDDGGADGDGESGVARRVAPPRDHDTVGAVATDGDDIAAATSTGGRWYALAGRVGDVPQVGAGFLASPAGGASATGAGEEIAREGLARRAVQLLEQGADAPTAARIAIEEFDQSTDGDAGVIVMDSEGRAGEAYNSPAMQTARL
jgi:beta-aspartyl-peptidase (threonine type)